MNKKLVTNILTAGFLFSFVFASSASAFWPFDALFKKDGDVKAVTTEKKMMGDVGPGGSRAFMTYQTLVTMNDACRRMFSQTYPTPTKVRITPSTGEDYKANGRGVTNAKKMAADSTESINKMYELEFGIDKKSETELNTIYNNLKARCENIANLTTRMQRIYKGNAKPTLTPTSVVSVTSSPKMKCDLKSREKNYGCPANMICNEGYCQPDRQISLSPIEMSNDNSRDLTCGGIAGRICPDGYYCVTSRESANSKDATGTCVKSEVRDVYMKSR